MPRVARNRSSIHRKIIVESSYSPYFTICSRILVACVMGLTHPSPFFVVLQRPRSQKMTNSPEVSKGAVESPQETMWYVRSQILLNYSGKLLLNSSIMFYLIYSYLFKVSTFLGSLYCIDSQTNVETLHFMGYTRRHIHQDTARRSLSTRLRCWDRTGPWEFSQMLSEFWFLRHNGAGFMCVRQVWIIIRRNYRIVDVFNNKL